MRVIVATDGTDLAIGAARRAREVLASDAEYILATAYEREDYDGSGFAGPTLTAEEADDLESEHRIEAETAATKTAAALELVGAEHVLLSGPAGPGLCMLAAERDADVLVIASHGDGPVRRAVLGSVSDHVVRNAPCPALVVTPEAVGMD